MLKAQELMKYYLRVQTCEDPLVCMSIDGQKVHLRDLRRVPPHCLDPEDQIFGSRRADNELFLNDLVITAYLALVRRANPHPQEVYVANTFLIGLVKTKQSDPTLLAQFSRKHMLKGYRRLLFPVHLPEKYHWTLLVLDVDVAADEVTGVSYYDLFFKDSAEGDARRHLEQLLPLLRVQGLGTISDDGKTLVGAKEDGRMEPIAISLCPFMQPNNYDCGTILLYFVECMCFKTDSSQAGTQEVLDQMRVKVLLRLVSGEFDLDTAGKKVDALLKGLISKEASPRGVNQARVEDEGMLDSPTPSSGTKKTPLSGLIKEKPAKTEHLVPVKLETGTQVEEPPFIRYTPGEPKKDSVQVEEEKGPIADARMGDDEVS